MAKNDEVAASVDTIKEKASEMKDQLVSSAAVAKDKAGEAMHAVTDQLPSTAAEWETVGKDLVDSIRRNPRPWVIGAAVFAVAWLLGRKSK